MTGSEPRVRDRTFLCAGRTKGPRLQTLLFVRRMVCEHKSDESALLTSLPLVTTLLTGHFQLTCRSFTFTVLIWFISGARSIPSR